MASELVGARELAVKLDQLSEKLRGSTLRKAANKAVKIVVAEAKTLIPVNKIQELHRTWNRTTKDYTGPLVAPGFAQRQIAGKVSISRDRRAVFAAIGVRKAAFYATQFVEVGTSKQPKQEWLRPAFKATQGQQLQAFMDEFRKQMLKVANGGK